MGVSDLGQAGATIEPTSEMINAGILAADLEEFEFGWSDAADLVRKVYLAMVSAAAPGEK